MQLLLGATLAAAVAALALGVVGARRVGRVALVAEVVMLIAMVDVHIPALGLVPAPFWALLLGGCALATALADRLRRTRRPHVDHLHALGMLLGAGFVLLAGPAAHGPGGASSTHEHGTVVLLPLVVAAAVHAGIVVRGVLGRRLPRIEAARRSASLASVLAMGIMVVAH